MTDISKRLGEEKIIAIFRGIPEDKITECARAVYRGGIRIFEITFNPKDPDTICKTASAFERLYSEFGENVTLGAGTVVRGEYVTEAAKVGAKFIVSPTTDSKVIELTHKNGMLSIPGAFTPNEIANAYRLGADIVKIFPILSDNITYLQTVISPLNYIPFIPTGGVNPSTARSFLDLGAVAVAAGATILTQRAVAEGDYGEIERNARAHADAVK